MFEMPKETEKGKKVTGTNIEAKPNAQGRESRKYHWFQWNRN